MKRSTPSALPLQDGVRLEAPHWASWGNPASVARRARKRVSLATILLLAFGNFMEPTSVVLILTPIVYPIALQLGIDPVHLGIIMVLNMQMGLVTPPVGLNLFVTAGVAKMSMEDVIRASLPWLMVLLSVLIAITYIPTISLIVPQMLGLI